MPSLHIQLLGEGKTKVTHKDNGKTIFTQIMAARPADSQEFSSTDLLAAALGSCIASSLESIFIRNDILVENVDIHVDKILRSNKRMADYHVEIFIARPSPNPTIIRRLEKAARSCMVHRSLSKQIGVEIKFIWSAD